jgi:catechol 2,3-dioxygenase
VTKFTIHPGTTVGKVALTVRDLPMLTQFYQEVIGLNVKEQTADKTILGTANEAILELQSNPTAHLVEPSTGLYHLAILVPDRPSLAHWLYQFLSNGYQLPGASDHGVSEALYLSDPEGNGIEIYRDRPRAEWPRKNGDIQMFTNRLDFEGLMKEVPQSKWQKMADGTTLGHVHLKVHNIPRSIEFYANVVGFDVTSNEYPGAGFVSAGGYDHHLGMNTWHSAGASPLPEGAAGLAGYTILLPNEAAREAAIANIQAAGVEVEETADGPQIHDPAGIAFILDLP